jgi:hypothetical protein
MVVILALFAYLPLQNTVVSRRKFVQQSITPSEWNFKPRLLAASLKRKKQIPMISLPSPVDSPPLITLSNCSISEGTVMHHLMDSPTRQEGAGSQVETKTDSKTQKASTQCLDSIQFIDFSPTLAPSTILSDVSSKKPETPMKEVPASSNNPSITTPSKSSSPIPKISTKETSSSSVEQASGRPKRSTVGSWLDGPSNSKSEDFVTTRSRIKSNVRKQALMIESQGIDITEAFMTMAKQQVNEDTIQEVNLNSKL